MQGKQQWKKILFQYLLNGLWRRNDEDKEFFSSYGLFFFLTTLSCVAAFMTPTPVPEHRLLMINVHGTSYDADGYSVYEPPVNAGADADWVNLSSDDQASQLINENDCDQIWIFDLSHSTDNYPTDWQAAADLEESLKG